MKPKKKKENGRIRESIHLRRKRRNNGEIKNVREENLKQQDCCTEGVLKKVKRRGGGKREAEEGLNRHAVASVAGISGL